MEGRYDDHLGAVVIIGGEYYVGVGVAYEPTVVFQKISGGDCDECGESPRKHYVIGSRNYYDEVQSVETIDTHGRT